MQKCAAKRRLRLSDGRLQQTDVANTRINALLFLFREVLKRDLHFLDAERAKKPSRIPVVLTTSEVATIFRHLKGRDLLFARILYGGGLRHYEGLRLRVKDVDVESRQLIVRDGKGAKNRILSHRRLYGELTHNRVT